jgi:adenosylcobinamide kinase/adenosylcobinamide-phosphate guanylyltransferase
LLIDCLTLWLSNLLAEGGDTLEFQKRALLTTLPEMPGHIILVSNETGLGIVPADPLSRHFRDEAGRLHQELAQLCDRVTLTVAGLPLTLKDALI